MFKRSIGTLLLLIKQRQDSLKGIINRVLPILSDVIVKVINTQEIYKVVRQYNLALNIETVASLLQVAQSINLLGDSNLRDMLSYKIFNALYYNQGLAQVTNYYKVITTQDILRSKYRVQYKLITYLQLKDKSIVVIAGAKGSSINNNSFLAGLAIYIFTQE